MQYFTQLEHSFPKYTYGFTQSSFYKLNLGHMFGLNLTLNYENITEPLIHCRSNFIV
jgi:hypothetical protein